MQNYRRVLSLGFLLLFSSAVSAQKDLWSLDECLNYARENNIQVRQSELQAQINKNNLQTTRWAYSPDLNFSSSYAWNFGLNIDPVTNTISQQSRQTANFSLNSNVVLYDGNRKWKSIAADNATYLASMYDVEAAKNDITLNVASAFLQILLNKEILAVAREQERVSQSQVNRMQKLVDAGANPKGDLLQLESQLARDKQNRVSAENSLNISKIQLANLLQLENPDDFDIVEPPIELPEATLIARRPGSILATAVEKQPAIKAAKKRIESSTAQAEIAWGQYLPSLSLSGRLNTNYSDQIREATGTTTNRVPIGIVNDANQTTVLSQPQTLATGFERKTFGDQIQDNVNEFIGVSLNMPIFNRMATRNNYQNARISQDQSRLRLEQEKNDLRQTIYQAHADAKASYNDYLAAKKAVEFNQETFNYARERYEVGAMNQFDFENAKNNLAVAQSQMLRAKFDYIFKIQVLEFYLTNNVEI